MEVRVGLVNGWPVYSEGLAAALRMNGYRLEQVGDPLSWSKTQESPLALVVVDQSAGFEVVLDLTHEARAVVVTLVDEVTVSTFQSSLNAGAKSAVSIRGQVLEVVLALEAARLGRSVIPEEVVRAMAGRARPIDANVTDEQIRWLREMAEGVTVAELGHTFGHSERDMFRRLRRLYRGLGARDRTQALLIADRLGLLA